LLVCGLVGHGEDAAVLRMKTLHFGTAAPLAPSRVLLVFFVCLLCIALNIADGLWKPALLRGPMIYFWAYDFVAWVLLPMVLLAALHSLTSISARDYGLSAALGWKDIAYVFPLPLFALFAVNIVAYGVAVRVVDYGEVVFSYRAALESLGPLWLLGAFYLAITAGLCESLFYIGLPWFCLGAKLGVSVWATRGFALVSALLFAAAHFESGMPVVVGAFAFQLVALRWYFKLGTLWPIIGAHALIDLYYFWP
jgi:membrane protease YdiL (CAAX protease family)